MLTDEPTDTKMLCSLILFMLITLFFNLEQIIFEEECKCPVP